MKRRHLLQSAMLGLPSLSLPAALCGAEAQYDLMLRGGRVIDPAAGTDAILDVAVSDGMITAVGPDLPGSASRTMDENGRVLEEVRQARRRGIRFDLGHGLHEHWNWPVAEAALAQDFPPDTISSDLNVPGRTEQVFNLPNVLSKFLLLGMPLADVIACATSHAAASFAEFDGLGSLRPGAVADITVLEPAEGDFGFVDNYANARRGNRKLLPHAVIYQGVPVT